MKSDLRSALACPAKCPGPMLVCDPLEVESDWTCQTCHLSLSSSQVTARIDSAKQVRSSQVRSYTQIPYKSLITLLVSPKNLLFI